MVIINKVIYVTKDRVTTINNHHTTTKEEVINDIFIKEGEVNGNCKVNVNVRAREEAKVNIIRDIIKDIIINGEDNKDNQIKVNVKEVLGVQVAQVNVKEVLGVRVAQEVQEEVINDMVVIIIMVIIIKDIGGIKENIQNCFIFLIIC